MCDFNFIFIIKASDTKLVVWKVDTYLYIYKHSSLSNLDNNTQLTHSTYTGFI